MSCVVVDASAVLRVVMDSAAQLALIDLLANAEEVLAPSLLRAETANALWKYRRAGVLDTTEMLARHVEGMSLVHRLLDDEALFPEALRLAADFDHPVCDALYVVSARRHAARLLTFDRRLHALGSRSQVDAVLFEE
jgi:predicted nucleic acid-binding protein